MMKVLCLLVPLLLAAIPLQGQQRWIQYDDGDGLAYRLVDWDSVALLVVDHRSTPKRINIFVRSSGQVQSLGRTTSASASFNPLIALARSDPRFYRGWPRLDGSFQTPARAEAYADITKAPSLAETQVVEVEGPAWVIPFPVAVAIADTGERARLRQALEQSLRP